MSENQNVSVRNKRSEMAAEAAKMYNIAYDLVNKTYLNKIESMKIVPLTDSGIENRDSINFRLVEITRIVHDEKKSALENLLNVLATLHPDYTVALIIKSNRGETHFYMGIRSSTQSKPASSGIKLLEQAIEGNFPGSDHRSLNGNEINSILDTSNLRKETHSWAIGSTSFIPSLKHDDTGQFTQGLERFIDAMYGKDYTAMILAEPVNHEQLVSLQTGYESMATTLSLYQKTQLSMSVNESHAISESITKGVTETLSNSVTLSQSFTQGSSISKSDTEGTSTNRAGTGASAGALIGGAIGLLGGPLGVAIGAAIGGGVGGAVGGLMGEKNRSHTESLSSNESNTAGESNQTSNSKAESVSNTKGSTQTSGESESISLEQHNKGIERMLSKIEQQLKRIDASRSYGIWNASFYVLSDSSESAHTACSLFKGILKGNESAVEDSAITIWSKNHDEKRQKTLEYFEGIVHPRLILDETDITAQVNVTPSSLVSGKELALLMNFPQKSVSGVAVIEMPAFGRNVVYQSRIPKQEDTIRLGRVYHYGKTLENSEIRLSLNSLTMHTFVTGSTGSGKTNTVNRIVREIMDKGKHYLVIEPSKGEYKELLGGAPNVHVYGTNPSYAPLLKLNPFEFPEKIHVLEHIDRLVEIFNACWPMYAAMPAILKSGIEEVYKLCGWNLEYSFCSYTPSIFPTIADLSDLLPTIIQTSLYSDELKSNYSGALVTRVNSLNSGLSGLLFTDHSIAGEILFDSNCIIDLSRVGSVETKALLMGIVFLKLHEYRQARNVFSQELKHVTVLEEAHQLLRKTSQEQSQESSNLLGKSVEMITNAIAEMRAFGEGFIIVDQAPGLLDPAVIRNTNTKIILKLPEESDRKITGGSAFLSEAQIDEIPRFPTGVAAVYQNNWMMPVLCNVDLVDERWCFKYEDNTKIDYSRSMKLTSALLSILLKDLVPTSENGSKPAECFNSDIEYNDLIDFIKLSRFRSKTQLLSIIEDIKNGVSNDIMKEENSYKLSNLISNIVDYKSILREVRIKTDISDYEDWTIAVMSALESKYQIRNEYEKLVLIGLMLEQEKVMSEHGNEFYDNWNNYLRSKLLVK